MRQQDPFERAVEHERKLRRRPFDVRQGLKIAVSATVVTVLGWAGLVALHFRLFPDPRWLAVTHLIVYCLFLGSTVIGGIFAAIFLRKNPHILDEGDELP